MESQPKFRPNPDRKLMDQVREVLRYHHYAYRMSKAIVIGYSATYAPTVGKPVRAS